MGFNSAFKGLMDYLANVEENNPDIPVKYTCLVLCSTKLI